MPKFYRKKPVVIEAALLKSTNITRVAEWCSAEIVLLEDVSKEQLKINTLEGVMRANIGDYIIKGVKGEFYPCKPDIFAATYEAADE